MSREIMQQALDALKLVYEQADFSNGVTDPTGTIDEGRVVIGGIVSESIQTLEAALAHPEQEPICRADGRCQYAIDHGAEGLGHCPQGKCCMPQPEQEPVAYMGSAGLGYDKNKYLSIPLYTAPPKPEPKSISTNDHLCAMLRQVHDVLACTALPMKRPWQGLTEDDVAEVERWVEFKEAGSGQIVIGKLVRYIELKLRSKNNAV